MEIILHESDINTSDEVIETQRSKELKDFFVEYLKAYEKAYVATYGITYELP